MCSPTNAASGPTVTSNQSVLLYIYATGIITIIVAALSLLKEAYQAIQFKLRYITVYNMVEVVLYISALVLAFAVVRESECLCPHRIQYQFGAVAVFLAWINFVLYFRKLAYTGKGPHFEYYCYKLLQKTPAFVTFIYSYNYLRVHILLCRNLCDHV